MIGVISFWTVIFTLLIVFWCGVHPKVEGVPSSNTKCVDLLWLSFWYAISDTVLDILVIIMPYPYVKRLQIGRREKVAVFSIFLLGALYVTALNKSRFGL